MEEYLKTLLEQIRCRKAHPAIERELRSHMEEQILANRAAGMEEEEAVRRAIQDMGDPVETGVRLDRVHRPAMAWDVVGIMAFIALLSIALHLVIGMGAEEINYQPQGLYIRRAVGHTAVGFAAMLLVYRLDYSILAKHGRQCAVFYLAFLTLGVFVFNAPLHGAALFVYFGGMSFSVVYALLLYVPFYGAVLYRYRGSGWGGLIKSLLFLVYPVWLAFRIPCVSFAVLLLFILSVMLSAAVFWGWYRIPKKRVIACYWTVLAVIPAAGLFMAVNGFGLSEYQRVRILAFLDDGMRQYSYVTKLLVDYFRGSRLFGSSNEAVAGFLPDYNSNYILAFLSVYFGIAAAFMVCILIGVLSVKVFRIALGQKNRFGMMMGLGSGLALCGVTVLNVLENLGILPTTMTFLPFFSYTGTGTIVSYILMGVVLSVYRYKSILPAEMGKPEAV